MNFRSIGARALLGITAALVLAGAALAQGSTVNNAVGVWGQDTGTGKPCLVAPAPNGSSTCQLPGSGGGGGGGNAAASAIASAVPGFAGYTGLNNAGSLIGWKADGSGDGYVNVTNWPSVVDVNAGNNGVNTPRTVAATSANFTPGQVSVGTSATLIAALRAGRNSITVENFGTTDVYIGGSGVTTATGQLLPGVKGGSITLPFTGAVYGIVASGSQTVGEDELY